MYVVTGDEMHQIDRFTMEHIGLSEETLMENAGQAFFRQLLRSINKGSKIIILIGSGNNGGDGFVIARLLKEAQIKTNVWLIPQEGKIKGAALRHKEIYENSHYIWHSFEKQPHRFYEQLKESDVLIDAMLGTGVKGIPRRPYSTIIEYVNTSWEGKVVSVDIPSGLPSHECGESFLALNADETYTFDAYKVSTFLPNMDRYYGKVHALDIAIPKRVYENISVKRQVITEEEVKQTLPDRDRYAHKGTAGKSLIIGGSVQMPGASILTTSACLRSGSGLVTLAVPDVILPTVSQKLTESMFLPLRSEDGELTSLSIDQINDQKFDAIAFGPGVGRANQYQLYKTFNEFDGPLIIDADGLYHLSLELSKWKKGREGGPTIVTPHVGEMARLMNISLDTVEKNRFDISKRLAITYNMYVVLKGPNTIVTTPDGKQRVNMTGNSALAKGGSGDMLTGMILSFVLQHQSVLEAICNAVHLHGKVADERLKEYDVFSITASDLINHLPKVLKSYRYHS
ncbi:NAD(P)H-hydrate dehydratase [Bacillus shivajii]|uniref:NAD(P)H-hydrate dehydratase n=1 Tax=Bacillus shivajii TaxID=1983719 RepID=UPI001CFA3BE2|nr:NAD(P)H-hydrate dehydratase [Bacillus shivajii]UCZ53680.1 NAD(P)H-hydrate dehydratase [Bacillus shivajii]